MSNKVQLRLMSSSKMSNAGEGDIIRFPKAARQNFGFSNSRVMIGKGPYEIALKVKKAYSEDVRRLAVMIKNVKISEVDAQCVGFVHSNVRKRIVAKRGGQEDIWITEGIGDITVGADPEFGLIDSGGMLVRGNNIVSKVGKFGSDGPSVEVRPTPSTNHLEVVGSISDIMENPPGRADDYKWTGGATFRDTDRVYWFGGHVHLGRPTQIDANEAYPIYKRIATALDGLLALPMVRFDTPNPWERRNGCKYDYGKAGDIRADYPEQNRFEYRVLSGLWVVHPTLATIAIGAAKCIVETAYGRIAEKGFDPIWASQPISRGGMLKSFGLKGVREIQAVVNHADPRRITQDHLDTWERNIRNLDRFNKYRAEIEAMVELSKENPENIVSGMDLNVKRNWQERRTLLPRASKKLRKALDVVEEKRK